MCNPKSQNTLPAINEYRDASGFKDKQGIYIRQIESKNNESLLRSMRYLQKSQDYETKQKKPAKIESKEVDCNLTVQPVEKRVRSIASKKAEPKQRLFSICPFTENKYIKDVYIKNIVPDIIGGNRKYRKKRRSKKLSKIRKINKSQIQVDHQSENRINMNKSLIVVDD